MSYRARVYDQKTGAFLLECRVSGQTLSEAEGRAIAKAALCLRGDPSMMDVRQLHEMPKGRNETPHVVTYGEGAR